MALVTICLRRATAVRPKDVPQLNITPNSPRRYQSTTGSSKVLGLFSHADTVCTNFLAPASFLALATTTWASGYAFLTDFATREPAGPVSVEIKNVGSGRVVI